MQELHWSEAVREAREARGMSRADLAKAVGVGERTVGRWESGHDDEHDDEPAPGRHAYRWVER